MVVEAVGRYRLLRKLASGNMGEIFLAEQGGEAGFRKELVVKRLFAHLAMHPEAVRMFQDEAHVLSCLSHPNIPQIYDLGFTEGRWFIALEHVPGHTLAELCTAGARSGLPMPLDATIAAIEQLCDALHHAHERCGPDGRPMRVVHRDVTPHNLMVTPEGYAKLLDFGVVRTAREDTVGGGVKGTLAYMSPEQVRGQRLDKRSDVFSVGIVLYELTTGRRLFQGTEVEIMTAIVERDVTPPTAFIPGYPRELETIVLTALARDRSRRWPSASHFARTIEDYCASLGLVPTHQALARYYQQVFSSEEQVARASGSYRPVPSRSPGSGTVPPLPSSAQRGAPAPTRKSSGTVPPVPSSASRGASELGRVQGSGTVPPVPGSVPHSAERFAEHARGAHSSQSPRATAIGSRPPMPSAALDDLRALRTPPPPADRFMRETPRALHLPSADDTGVDETPLVLSRPKRGA